MKQRTTASPDTSNANRKKPPNTFLRCVQRLPDWCVQRLPDAIPVPDPCRLYGCAATQQGQALAEGMLVLLLAGLLWVAIVQIGQLQDMAVQAQHASRVAAFAAAHDTLATDTGMLRHAHFSGTAHRWRDHAGRRLLPDPAAQVSLQLMQDAVLPVQAQPGQTDVDATRLRREWRLDDVGLVRAAVAIPVQIPFHSAGQMGVTIRRHTVILRDAGHSPNADSAQRRVGASAFAWADAARRSQAAGRRVQKRLEALDAPWHRPSPSYDWLMPWAGAYPGQVEYE